MNVLELHDVELAYAQRVVLSGVSLVVEPKERVAVLGRNGVGKSTLLDVIVGVRAPRRGRVQVLGRTPPVRGVGFVPQDTAASFLPWFSVRDNLTLPLRLSHAGKHERERGLAEVRERFDPAHGLELDASIHTLSTGQLQLAALLRAFIARPKLVVCDEPFSALDAHTREHARRTIAELCAPPDGPALVLVTHDAEDVRVLAHRSFVLNSAQPQPDDSLRSLHRVGLAT